jgi:hypothetical protein
VTRVTLKTLAEDIRREWPDLYVKVEQDHVSTDWKIPGTRLRHPGKGRRGLRIIVQDPNHAEYPRSASTLLDHSNAETYRRTSDVVAWIERYRAERKAKRRRA